MNFDDRIKKYVKKNKRRKAWERVLVSIAAVVVFATTYMLILPAITKSTDTYCGYEEHIHSDDCYTEETELTCKKEESEGHTHDGSCYETEEHLICGQEESEATEESEGHTHDDSCYETEEKLVCGKKESEGHQHDEDCYTTTREMTCGMEEHEHTLACYSNPEADVESASVWEKTVSGVKLTGDKAKDVVAIAETQLGYQESEDNYEVEKDGETTHGYTRYGAWFGDEYGEWSGMFASFCLNYAGISTKDFPEEATNKHWISSLKKYKLWHSAGSDYEPKAGDLVILEDDLVGIVATADGNDLQVIIGDYKDEVTTKNISANGSNVAGFGEMPEDSKEEKAEKAEEMNNTEEETEEAVEAEEEIEDSVNEEENQELADDENLTDEEALSDELLEELNDNLMVMSLDDEEEDEPDVPMVMSLSDSSSSLNTEGVTELTQYITSLQTSKSSGGSWVENTEFSVGERVRVDIAFSIPAGIVTSDSPSIYYPLPDGFLADDAYMTGRVFSSDGNECGTYEISHDAEGNPVIVITYDSWFANGNAFDGTVFFETTVLEKKDGSSTGYKFPGVDAEIIIKKDTEKYDASIYKEGKLNDNGKLEYTITLSSVNGTDGQVGLGDLMAGCPSEYSVDYSVVGATIDGNVTIQKYDSSGNPAGDPIVLTDVDGKNTFVKYLPALGAGEKYVATYTATPNMNNTTNTGAVMVYNYADTKLENHPDYTRNTGVWNKVRDVLIQKTGEYDKTTGLIYWTLTVNNPDGIDLAGKTVEDALQTSGINIKNNRVYVIPDSFDIDTAQKQHAEEMAEIWEKVQTGEMGLVDAEVAMMDILYPYFTSDDTGFSYTFPSGSTETQYEFMYLTNAPDQDGTVVNGYSFEGDKTYTSSVGVGVSHRSDSIKKLHYTSDFKNAPQEGKDLYNDSGVLLYYMENEDGSGRKEAWHLQLTLAESDELQEILIQDTIMEAKDSSGNSIAGSHYGIRSEMQRSIENSLYLTTNQETSISYSDLLQYYDIQIVYYHVNADGSKTEVTDDNLTVNEFEVRMTPKVTKVGNYQAVSLDLKYYTQIVYPSTSGYYEFYNRAVFNNKVATKAFRKTIVGTYEKSVYTRNAGEWTRPEQYQDWKLTNYIYDGDGANVEYGEGTITYRLLLKPGTGAASDGPITITDQLPEGMEYVEDSVLVTMPSFNNSTKQSSTELIREDSSSVTFSDGTLTIQVAEGYTSSGNYNGYLAIYYTVRITDPDWDTKATTKKIYANSATWTQKNLTDVQTTTIVRPIQDLMKEASYDENTHTASYKVTINAKGEDLDPDADILKLTDKLTAQQGSAVIALDSVKLYEYDLQTATYDTEVDSARYSYTYNEESKTLSITVPDGLACVLKYQYKIDPMKASDDYSITNTASLEGIAKVTNQETIKKQSSGSTADRKMITLYKVDKDDYSKKLANVEFELYQYDMTTHSWGSALKCVTAGNGQIVFDNKTNSNNIFLQQNQLYKIVETKTIRGYALDSTPYYFVWSDGVSSTDIRSWWSANSSNITNVSDLSQDTLHYLENKSANIYIENTCTEVSVKKVWVNPDGTGMTNPPSNVTVQLNKVEKKNAGKKITIETKNNSKDLYVDENSSLTIKFPNGYWQDYAPNITGPKEDYMHLTYEIPEQYGAKYYTLLIDAVGLEDQMIVSIDEWTDVTSYEYKYRVGQIIETTPVGSPVKLNAENNWSYTWDDLEEDLYNVTELKVDGTPVEDSKYTVSYYNNGGIKNGEIVVTNKKKATSIDVKKLWKDVPADEKMPEYIIFDLFKDGKKCGSYKLYSTDARINGEGEGSITSTGAWQATISNLEFGPEYTVEETYVGTTPVRSSMYTSTVSGTTITNTYHDKEYELPHTGGIGTRLITMLGVLLMAGSGLMILKKHRKEENW